MAGVSPQRGGSNATMIGMVVSIVVSVILAVVLVILFTNQETLRNDAVSAKTRLEKITQGAQETEIRKLFPTAQSGTGNKTLVSEIMRSGKGLMVRFTGDQTDSAQTAIAKLDAAIAKIAGDKQDENAARLASANGAVALIESLFSQYTAERDARLKSEKSNQKALKGLEDAEARAKQLAEAFDNRLAKLTTQVEELQKAKSDFEQVKGDEVRALASKVEATRNELEDTKRTHNQQKRLIASTLKEQDEMLQSQAGAIREYKGNVPTNAEPLAIARSAVGKVMRILPGDSLCYINLGREDNVTLGMTFSVYSSDERIPANGRGKASLEVKSVDMRTAECRVVSPPSPDDPILEGDSINNIVLSRNRAKKQRFVVVGEFDTDFDGEADIRGREQIISLIQRWGGEVVEEVTAATDYVVLGLPPKGEDVVPRQAVASEPEEDTSVTDNGDDEESSDDEEATSDDEESDEDDEASSDDEESSDDEDASDDEEESDDEEDGDGGNGGDGANMVPGIQRKAEVDPTLPAVQRRYASEAERYREARRRAAYFSVPVLKQDQFYNFIGIEGKLSDIRRLQG